MSGVPKPFVVAILNRYAHEGDILLDIGCGGGMYRGTTPARYIGIDYTDKSYTPELARELDIVADATYVPIKENCVDLIMSKSAFYQFPNPQASLEEFLRVLKPGGRVILFDYNRRTQKYLEPREKKTRPCWTQCGLRDLVRSAGFGEAEILLPMGFQPPAFIRAPVIALLERLGSWAIVTAVKNKSCI